MKVWDVLQAIASLERTLVSKREEQEAAGEKTDKSGVNYVKH